MNEYIVDNDYALPNFLEYLEKKGIQHEVTINNAAATIKMKEADAARTGLDRLGETPQQRSSGGGIWLAIVLLILAAAFLFGCGVPYKKLAEECAERYPVSNNTEVRDTIIHDTIYYPEYKFDFIDTTDCPPHLPDTFRIIKTVTKTVPILIPVQIPRRDSIIRQRDTAAEDALKNQLADLQKQLHKAESKTAKGKVYFWAFWLLVLICAVVVGFMIRSILKKK